MPSEMKTSTTARKVEETISGGISFNILQHQRPIWGLETEYCLQYCMPTSSCSVSMP
jgi:hypothetical protein